LSRRTLVFDIGGVVVRWQPLALLRAVLPQHARDEAQAAAMAVAVFQGLGPETDWALFDRGRIEPAALAARIAARTGYPAADLLTLIAAVPAHLTPMAESVALLERARAAGHRLALLSNMPRPYADHLEACHACFGWFDARVFSGRVGLVKPERAMFDLARDSFALDLDDALFIDDHPANIAAAQALGWQALHFEDAARCDADLRRLGWL
jgi:HAD superfamily hydrolase (TIGR01509 family)